MNTTTNIYNSIKLYCEKDAGHRKIINEYLLIWVISRLLFVLVNNRILHTDDLKYIVTGKRI